jgi:pyruvate/2-oxoacid:ferredoxin oxidoreductase alpha subunit
MMDDAEVAFFIQGAHANTCKSAIRHLRAEGLKVGMVRPRWIRPWPTQQIAEAMAHVKALACVETSTSYGGATRGGNLIHEVSASLYDLNTRPLLTSFMAGLGGDVIMLDDFYYMAKILKQMVQENKTRQKVYWVGFEDEA